MIHSMWDIILSGWRPHVCLCVDVIHCHDHHFSTQQQYMTKTSIVLNTKLIFLKLLITLTLNDWVHIFIHKCICQDIDTNICCITVTSLIIDPIRCGLTLWWQSMPIWKITLLLFVFCCVHYKVKRPEYSLRKVLSWAKIFLKLPGRPLVLGRYREDLCGAS